MNEAIYLPNERNDTLIEILTFFSLGEHYCNLLLKLTPTVNHGRGFDFNFISVAKLIDKSLQYQPPPCASQIKFLGEPAK